MRRDYGNYRSFESVKIVSLNNELNLPKGDDSRFLKPGV